MAITSPKYGLIRNVRGWVKRVGKVPRWIVSAKKCPTGEEADEYFRLNFASIADDKQESPASKLTLEQACELHVEFRISRNLHKQTIKDHDDTNMRIMRDVGKARPLALLNDDDAAAVDERLRLLGTARRLKHVINIRSLIRWCNKRGYAIGWTLETFTPPTRAERRRDRSKRRKLPYSANEIRRLLRHSSDRLRALILLCLNAAMGPDEVLTLTKADIKSGVISKARQKTGVERRVPLWPETRDALKSIKTNVLFANKNGKPAAPETLIRKFRALCDRACVTPRGLYTMRRTFRTIADDWGDHRAAALVMGRELPDMDTVYVLTIKDERIERMLEHIKHVLRIDRALRAKRYGQGQRSFSKRLARWQAAREAGPSKPSKRRGNNATARRPASREPRPKH